MKVPFKLVGLRTKQFAILSDVKDNSIFNVQSSFEFEISKEESLIKIISSFLYECEGAPLLKLEVEGVFQIEPSCWTSWIEGTTCTIPVGLLQHLATIVVGASRGILLERTEGTPFASHYLPLLDLTKVIDKDSVFEIGRDSSK